MLSIVSKGPLVSLSSVTTLSEEMRCLRYKGVSYEIFGDKASFL